VAEVSVMQVTFILIRVQFILAGWIPTRSEYGVPSGTIVLNRYDVALAGMMR
jgi:hypothetical protein